MDFGEGMMELPNTSDRARLFVAIPPSEPVREALSALTGSASRIRWTPPGQFHLSLRFIGAASPADCERMVDALRQIRVRAFLLGVEGVGCFPAKGEPRVLWAGVGSGHPFLHQLRQQVDDCLLGAGVSFELRPFVPHITLGRTREPAAGTVAAWLKQHRNLVGPVWPVDRFQLMASESSGDGVHHRLVQDYTLAGPDAAAARGPGPERV